MSKSTFPVTEHFRKLRERAGYSMDELAKAIGYARASSIQRYENENEFSKDFIHMDLGAKLADALVGRGTPPILDDEVWALANPEARSRLSKGDKRPLISSYDPDDDEVEEEHFSGVAIIDGSLQYRSRFHGGSPETTAAPGAGMGQDDGMEIGMNSDGIASGHEVVDEWVIPEHYVRSALDAKPSQILIMPVVGHSMEPMLRPNDRVLVDVSQNIWAGEAVYVIIDDGGQIMQVKTLRKLPATNPPLYEIISEAHPDRVDPPLSGDQFRIIGRVVGRFSRM
ncbi:LexA family transcriptional regulator [Paraburkholderia aspalathi]|nr:LexA family transcriptional regulator [Paraburkholderia aspalathi]